MQKRKTLGELKALGPLLGKSRGEARVWLKESKVKSPAHSWVNLEVLRVVREDGIGANLFMNQCLERVNVEMENGVISKILDVG